VEHFFVGLAVAVFALVYLAFYFGIRGLFRMRTPRPRKAAGAFPGGRFGGGIVVQTEGLGLAAGKQCDLGLDDQGVVMVRPSSADLLIPFEDLRDFGVATTSRPGGHIVGGGFGVRGAVEGVIGAAVVNSLLDRSRSVSVVGLETARGAHLVVDYTREPVGGREEALRWVRRRSRARLTLDLEPFTEGESATRWVSCEACDYRFAVAASRPSGICPSCGTVEVT